MTLKQEITIGIVIAAIPLAFFGVRYLNRAPAPAPQTAASPAASASPSGAAKITRAEIAKHAIAADCWISIGDKALDVTAFMERHPGGAAAIIPYCGKDATDAFGSIRMGAGHPAAATAMFDALSVGTVE